MGRGTSVLRRAGTCLEGSCSQGLKERSVWGTGFLWKLPQPAWPPGPEALGLERGTHSSISLFIRGVNILYSFLL